MKVYQASNGSWIYFDGIQKFTNLTQKEAYAMLNKAALAGDVQTLVTRLGSLDDTLDVVNAKEYGQGQADAFTDGDVSALGFTADDMFNALNLISQIQTLLTNGTPAEGDYMPTINRVRSAV